MEEVGMKAAEPEFREELLAEIPGKYWTRADGTTWLSPQEFERRRLGAARSKLAFSSNPLFVKKAESISHYWERFYDSHINW